MHLIKKLTQTRMIPFLVTAFIVSAEIAISFNSVLLPNIKEHFVVSNYLAQMTLAAGLFALGFSGVIYGGVSDSMGRRPLFLFSTALFAFSSLVCALAPSIEVFILARFFQGVGAGAGWIVGNACLSDLFSGDDYLDVMNYVHAVAGITPAIAPMIGSYIAIEFGWKSCFLALAFFGLITAVLMTRFLNESLPLPRPLSLSHALKGYSALAQSGDYRFYLTLKAICAMLLFSEIGNIPLIFIDTLGVDPLHYSYYIVPVFALYVVATVYCSRLLRLYGVDRVLYLGLGLLFLSNLLTALFVLFAPITFSSSALWLQGFRSLSFIGWGLVFGNATAKIVGSLPGREGAASAMMMAGEMLLASWGIWVLGLLFDGTILPLAWHGAFWSFIAMAMMHRRVKEKRNDKTRGKTGAPLPTCPTSI